MKAGKYNCSIATAIGYTIDSLDFNSDFRYSAFTLVKHIGAKKTPSPREPVPSAAYSIALGITGEEEEEEEEYDDDYDEEEDDEEDEEDEEDDDDWDYDEEEPHYSEEMAKKVKIIKDVFKTSKMEIVDSSEAGHVKLLFTIFSTKGGKCARFEIDFENDLIDIFNVYACDIGGTKVLQKLEILARRLKIKHLIIGQDDSHIRVNCNPPGSGKVEIDLAMISILTTGESWYNRHGYKQNYESTFLRRMNRLAETTLYEEQTAHNRRTIETKSVESFILNNIIVMGLTTRIESVLEYGQHTVKSYFTIIHDKMKKGEYNCKQLKIIAKILKDIKNGNPFEPPIKYAEFGLVKRITPQVH
jgi:hypothetical protein